MNMTGAFDSSRKTSVASLTLSRIGIMTFPLDLHASPESSGVEGDFINSSAPGHSAGAGS
jgi:hypothetical protein